MQSLPEALRLAPNLQVTRLSANNYVVSARGFGGNPAVQNFSNKLSQQWAGATLWEANVMNGVISLITRAAADTQRHAFCRRWRSFIAAARVTF